MNYGAARYSIIVLALLVSFLAQGVTAIEPTGHDVSRPVDGMIEPPRQLYGPVAITPITFPELRYRLIDHFGRVFFCDPDVYPIGHDVSAGAIGIFPEIVKDAPAFQAMAKHLGLEKVTEFTDVQRLLFYQEYKRLQFGAKLELAGDRVKFSLRYADDPRNRNKKTMNNGFSVQGFIDSRATIEVTESISTRLQCPLCLAAGTRISIPTGEIAVEELKPGMSVWTVDAHGAKVATLVLNVRSVPVPATHKMVHLSFKDGRELWVSPGHPTADGRFVEQLRSGATYEGATIQFAGIETYSGRRTFDILLAGDTGFYWANGVLLASTLK